MLTRINEFKSRNAASPPRPLSAVLLTASLAIVVAGCLTLAAPIIWSAAKMALQSSEPTLAQCELIAADTDRLACFDRLGKQTLQPPAKGAFAPVIAH